MAFLSVNFGQEALAGSMLAAGVFAPAAVLSLCVVAGVATVLLLPGRRERSIGKIAGAVLLGCLLVLAAMIARQAVVGADAYFWIFSAIAVIAAVRVITHRRPVYSALYFVLTVMASAGLFVLLWAEFMAAALVLIYAGAILVTYVFVIMLATQARTGATAEEADAQGAECDTVARGPAWACLAGFALMGVMLFLIFEKGQGAIQKPSKPANITLQGKNTSSTPAPQQGEASAIRSLGTYLFKEQLITLEIAGLILTISMVGAIVIARRQHVNEIETDGLEIEDEVMLPRFAPDDGNPHSLPVGLSQHS